VTTKLRAATSSSGTILDPAIGDGVLEIYTGNNPASQVLAASFAADGTPTFLKYVPGSTIQTVMSTDAGTAGSTATSLTNFSAASQLITPKSTNSKILIRCTFLAYIAPLSATNVQGAISLYDSTNSTLIGNQITFGPNSGSGNVGSYSNQTIEFFVSNSALTSRGFTLRAATGNSSAPLSCTTCVWTLTEVQN
jgi:hypothetical protein